MPAYNLFPMFVVLTEFPILWPSTPIRREKCETYPLNHCCWACQPKSISRAQSDWLMDHSDVCDLRCLFVDGRFMNSKCFQRTVRSVSNCKQNQAFADFVELSSWSFLILESYTRVIPKDLLFQGLGCYVKYCDISVSNVSDDSHLTNLNLGS